MAWIIAHLAELEAANLPFSNVTKTSISRYASTSINIRHAVEQQTFSSLEITSDDLPMLEKLVTRCPSRHALLRHLSFQPVLPAYSRKAYTRFERRADRRRNDESFSLSMEKLFAALKPLDEIERAAPLRLFPRAPDSPSDPAYRDTRPWGSGYDPSLEISGDLSDARTNILTRAMKRF